MAYSRPSLIQGPCLIYRYNLTGGFGLALDPALIQGSGLTQAWFKRLAWEGVFVHFSSKACTPIVVFSGPPIVKVGEGQFRSSDFS